MRDGYERAWPLAGSLRRLPSRATRDSREGIEARFLRNGRLNSSGTTPNIDGAGVRRQRAEGPPDT